VAVLDLLEIEGLVERVAQAGQYLARGLADLVAECPGHALEVRGRGLLRGLAVAGPAAPIVARARERGVLLSVAGANVVRFAPPYVVDRQQLDEAVAILRGVLAEGLGRGAP
jgi:acetylornithine/N-succinyldiaminopimelate aminotransferase